MSNIKILGKKNDNMKSNFSKLTLSSRKPEAPSKIPIISNTDKRNWEKSLYKNQNETNTNANDIQKSNTNNLLTDDETDSESEKENIKNKILFSSSSLEKDPLEIIESESIRLHVSNTPVLSQLFSEKLQVSDSDETNCSDKNVEVENTGNQNEIKDWLTKLNKFESSESNGSAKIACSRNLFSENTDESEIRLKNQFHENKVRNNHLQNDVNRLSATLQNLELTNKNTPSIILSSNVYPSLKDFDSIPVVTEQDDELNVSKQNNRKILIKEEQNKSNLLLDSTILTINSSICGSYNSSQNTSKSVILITESDISSDEYSRNVSSLNENEELNKSTLDHIDKFFNNIPLLEEPIVISSESKPSSKNSSSAKSGEAEELHNESHICISESDHTEDDDKDQNTKSNEIIGNSSSSVNDNKEIINSESVVLSKQNSQESSVKKQDNSYETYIEKINISAKIKINLKITEYSSDSDSKDICLSPSDVKGTPEKSLNKDGNEKSNESAKDESDTNINDESVEKVNSDKSIEIIDVGMEKLLNEIYGNEWKTPDMIKKCESMKNTERRQPATLDNTLMDDFNTFHRNINCNLESTRINQLDIELNVNPEREEKIKNVNSPRSNKKTSLDRNRGKLSEKIREREQFIKSNPVSPWLCKNTSARTPKTVQSATKRGTPAPNKFQERINSICDSDSSLSSDNDDTKIDIKKSVKKVEVLQKTKPSKKESTPESSDNSDKYQSPKKINDISEKALKFLDSCEFKKKSILERHDSKSNDLKTESHEFKKPSDLFATPKTQNTRRRLYTPCHDVVPDLEDTINVDEPEIVQSKNIVLKTPLPSWMTLKDKRLENIKSMEIKSPIVKKTDDDKLLTPKSLGKKIYDAIDFCQTPPNVYGFLRSLDVMVGLQFCHPKALQYRNNYKNNKEELTDILYCLYNEKIFDNKLDVSMKWNKKLLNTAGRCNNRRRGQIKSCVIDLSEKVLTSADRLRCTLVHELCHAAAWLFDGASGHGVEWKRWASRANKIFPELPKINVCHQYEIEYKYTYECVDCNARSHAHSKSKKVENIRCSYCHGAIKILLNKKDKEGNILRTPTREASGFAKFVKDKYKVFKNPDLTHAEVMKLLSREFNSMKMQPE